MTLGLLAPLVGAVRENVSLVESQSAMTSRVRTFRSRMEVLLDSLPSLVLSVDRELRLRYANRSAADLLGVAHGMNPQGGGRDWLERLHEVDREQVADAVPRLIDARDGVWQGVGRILDLDGAAHWLNLHLHPMSDPVENRPFVEAVATDVTDLQLARRSSEVRQSRLAFLSNVGQTVAGELAVERLLERFLVLGREVYPMASLVLYRPVPDRSALRVVAATGRGLDLLQAPEHRTVRAGDHPGWLAFGDGFPRLASPTEIGLTEDEAAGLRADGIRQMLFVPLLAAGVSVGVLGTGVTEGAHLGADDVDLLTQVGILLGGAIYLSDLVRELEEQRAVAVEASRLKSEFLANTSHELRTPLTAILGFLKLLMDGSVEDLDKQRDFLRITHESAEKLLNIINDVLDLAKIEAGRLEVHHAPVPVRRVLSDVETLFRHQMKSRGLAFDIQPAPEAVVLWADPDRTTQVLTNLLSNALKFTSRGGTVGLRCVTADDTVSFEVTDTGIGIPPDELDRVFDSFYQVDGSSTRQYGGTGLGLTISRRLAEMMGGSLELESDGADLGTTARLTLRKHQQAVPDETPQM
jgi:PAS domain S-box-containing protein